MRFKLWLENLILTERLQTIQDNSGKRIPYYLNPGPTELKSFLPNMKPAGPDAPTAALLLNNNDLYVWDRSLIHHGGMKLLLGLRSAGEAYFYQNYVIDVSVWKDPSVDKSKLMQNLSNHPSLKPLLQEKARKEKADAAAYASTPPDMVI